MSKGEGEGAKETSTPAWSIPLRHVLPLAALVLVPLLFYSSMVFRGWEPPAPDTTASRPFSLWGVEATHQLGEVPLWYPYIFSGMPSYGSFLYTPRNPLNLTGQILRFFPNQRGVRYWILFVVAGLATFAFIRRQGASRLASAVTGLLYSMTPYFPGVIAAGHATKLEALCLVPVLLLALDLFLKKPDPMRAAGLGLAAAWLGWAHHPQIAFYGLLIGGLYGALVLLLEERKRLNGRAWIRLGIFLLLGVSLAGAMVAEPYLGVLEYAPHSIRGGSSNVADPSGASSGGAGWEYATAWSFHPKELISFLVPGWYGLEGETYWGPMPFTQSTHYFGVVAVALAIIGLLGTKGSRRWIWAVISGVILLIGFGRHVPILYGPMYAVVPSFNKFRVPSMIYSLLPLCAGFLVASGIDAVAGALARIQIPSTSSRTKKKGPSPSSPDVQAPFDGIPPAPRWTEVLRGSLQRWWLIVAILFVLALALSFALEGRMIAGGELLRDSEVGRAPVAALEQLQAERFALLRKSLIQGLLFLLLLLACLQLGKRRLLAPSLVAAAISVLAISDVILVDRLFYHPEPPREVRSSLPIPGAADYLAKQPGPFRIFPAGPLFGSNAFGLAKLESVGGYQPAKLRIYQDLIDAGLMGAPGVLQMLNVHYVVSASPLQISIPPAYAEDGHVYAIGETLPRAWSVARVELVRDSGEMMRRLKEASFRPEESAMLYRDAAHPEGTTFAPAQVAVEELGLQRIRLRTQAEGPAFVVLSEIDYAPGWRAKINGAPVPIYRTNHVLRGLEVPAGSHEVVVELRSPGRERGVLISRAAGGAAFLLILAGLIAGRVRTRRASGD